MRDRAAMAAMAVHSRGGVIRSAELQRAGVPKRAIGEAVARGMLVRERRVWVAHPDADPDLRLAARTGAVLSCVTQAKRKGLWVERQHGIHLACSPHAGMVHAPVLHRFSPLVPRHPGALEDPVENVLQAVALCQPFEEALAIWDSALNKGLVTLQGMSRLPLSGQALQLLSAADPYRDSGLETYLVVRLRWLGLPIRVQVWLHGHRVDALIGERLVLQIDGGTHVGAQRTSDNAHDAELILMGYYPIRVGYEQVMHRWHEVQDLIQRAVAQGLHLAR